MNNEIKSELSDVYFHINSRVQRLTMELKEEQGKDAEINMASLLSFATFLESVQPTILPDISLTPDKDLCVSFAKGDQKVSLHFGSGNAGYPMLRGTMIVKNKRSIVEILDGNCSN